ncbi:MAG: DEAD/DEAH box helicase [Thermoanaerobaculia bacterium]
MEGTESLGRFDPRLRDWFERRYGRPTEIQELAWGPISRGEHVLVSAPTGSGKTLTGFFWALQQLTTGAWRDADSGEGGVRVLYVSPLKALNADIERNLVEPLAGLERAFAEAGTEMPAIRVGVRSGDTPPAERQRMLRRPPQILITTPESLNLLLLSRHAPRLLGGTRTVILDEIHAVAGSKRGAHLVTAVERLALLAGEFQRIGISATVEPRERIAVWMGGRRVERGAGGAIVLTPRRVRVVTSTARKRYDLAVRSPAAPASGPVESREPDELWQTLAVDLRREIAAARSTLVFTNSRRLSEKLTRLINEAPGPGAAELAWSHHGSLSRELRTAVESRLKEGLLPAIVATSSLELGIDIGALDQVLMVQTPRSLASAAQRAGRAGHNVGDVCRAAFHPTHARDRLEAAVAARAVAEGTIEAIRPVAAPLDLLAQWVLSMTVHESRSLDELFELARAADPFFSLSRRTFDLVIDMLIGRYDEARIAELRPRLALDAVAGTVRARRGTALLLARSGGTIPDRGYFQLRTEESNSRLGELDEEFVWERAVGDTFVLGTLAWKIRRITSNELFVSPSRTGAALAPFWKADARDRGALFSERIGRLLERLEEMLEDPDAAALLASEYFFDAATAESLLAELRETRAALGGQLPHRHRLIFEEMPERGERALGGRRQVVLYTFWGGGWNRPLAMALRALWEEREGTSIETAADDDAVLLQMPEGVDPRELLAALDPERLHDLLRSQLEGSGLFGAQFRQNAQRALLLPRSGPGRRTPLWLARESAKRLLEAVARFDDFPLTLETWRSCLEEELDVDGLRERLEELRRGRIAVELVRSSRPSPFAAGLVWQRTNQLMYEDDVPPGRRAATVRADLVREVARGGDRPTFGAELVERYRRRVQRLLPGYAPESAEELVEWTKERLWITDPEWDELLAAVARDHPATAPGFLEEAESSGRIVRANAPAGGGGRVARDFVARLDRADAGRFEEWLRYQPPLPLSAASALWGVSRATLERMIEPLVASGALLRGELLEGGGDPDGADQIATAAAVETLLRWRRAAHRSVRPAWPLDRLPLFLARWQGLLERGSGGERLQPTLDRLLGYPAPAPLWEGALLPARLEPYRPAMLDRLFEESRLCWFGAGRERLALAFPEDLDLFPSRTTEGGEVELPAAPVILAALAGSPRGLDLEALREVTGRSPRELVPALWRLVWSGRIVGDSVRALREGVLSGFEGPADPAAIAPTDGRPPRAGRFRRWSAAREDAGRWALRDSPRSAVEDPLLAAERDRELARILLERYGVLFRELLIGELPGTWARIARALRLLELSGEISSGPYFEGVPGLQFATPAAALALEDDAHTPAVWWCSAHDPVSLCGSELEPLRALLPHRLTGTDLVYRGSALVASIRRGGREIDFHVGSDDPDLERMIEPLELALTRAVRPQRAIDVERINGEEATRSAYARVFGRFDRTREGARWRLRRSYRPSAAVSAAVEPPPVGDSP